jgi:hypothetical protein
MLHHDSLRRLTPEPFHPRRLLADGEYFRITDVHHQLFLLPFGKDFIFRGGFIILEHDRTRVNAIFGGIIRQCAEVIAISEMKSWATFVLLAR